MQTPAAGSATPMHDCALRARLRAATADLHAQVDGLFPRGLDSVAAYHRYVLGMHRFAIDYEIAVDAAPRHSSWLVRDLVALSLPPMVALGVRRPVAGQAARLGWDYVMAGSGMGARALVRDAHRLGFDGRRGACFLERHAAGDDWATVRMRMRAFDASDAGRLAQAEAGACAAFALVRACFERSFEALPTAPPTRIRVESRP